MHHLILVAALSLVTAEDFVPNEVKIAEKDKRKDGLIPKLAVGLTLNVTSNNNFVGQVEGVSLTLGVAIASQLDYNDGPHESRTVLTIGETFTRTPQIERFIKSTDSVSLESLYYYHVVEWVGPFGKFNLDTAIFPGFNENASDVRYDVTFNDEAPGDCDPSTISGKTCSVVRKRFQTSDAFQPLTLKESAGAFVVAVDSKPARLDFRLGVGARETFAAGTFAAAKSADGKSFVLTEVGNVFQLGAEASAAVNGATEDDRVVYRAGVDVMTPFVNSGGLAEDLSVLDRTNIEFAFRVAVKLAAWASLAYEAKVLRIPLQDPDKVQVQNNLLFALTYDVIKPEEAPAAK